MDRGSQGAVGPAEGMRQCSCLKKEELPYRTYSSSGFNGDAPMAPMAILDSIFYGLLRWNNGIIPRRRTPGAQNIQHQYPLGSKDLLIEGVWGGFRGSKYLLRSVRRYLEL